MRSRALMPLVLLAVLASARTARADEISPPPSDCAPGTIAHSSHVGEWCEDTSCETDAQCDAEQVCREVAACVDTPGARATGPSTVDSPRGSSAGPGRPVYGTCFDGRCARGACERAKRCVARDVAASLPTAATGGGGGGAGGGGGSGATGSPPALGARDRGCACTAGGVPLRAGAAFALSLGAVLAFVLSQRRRRALVALDGKGSYAAGHHASRGQRRAARAR